mmetsp:Transcript_560/g.1459  ORF Transcript_560/g.1459 Transcript_560/m.1459 type:complete len:973 (-) Transcript_560:243-3161(-)
MAENNEEVQVPVWNAGAGSARPHQRKSSAQDHADEVDEAGRCRLFCSQYAGILIKSWHFERRQIGQQICIYLIHPLILIMLASLGRVLSTSDLVEFQYQEEPLGGFPPTPFKATQCFDNYYANSSQLCFENPVSPETWVIPVSVSSEVVSPEVLGELQSVKCNIADVAACENARNASLRAGFLGQLSLHPYVFPDAIPPASFSQTQTPYDGIYRYSIFQNQTWLPLYSQLMVVDSAQPAPLTDNAYATRAEVYDSVQDLEDELYAAFRSASVAPLYYGAIALERLAVNSSENSVSLNATLYYNNTGGSAVNCEDGVCQLATLVDRLMSAVFRSALGAVADNEGPRVTGYLRLFPKVDGAGIDFLPLVVSIVLGTLWHFLLPYILRALVYEKSSRLRIIMQMMGLRVSTYWLGTITVFYLRYLLYCVIMCLVGAALRVPFFVNNVPISWIALFLLWGLALIAFGVFLAPFFQSPQTALVIGWFYVVIVSLVGGPYIGQLYVADASEAQFNAVSVLPSFAFFRAVYYAGAYNAGGRGVTLDSEFYGGVQLGMCLGQGPFCIVYAYLAVQAVVLFVLGLYLDRVLPSVASAREHPLFFLGFTLDGERGGCCLTRTDGRHRGDRELDEVEAGGRGGEPADVTAEREAAERGGAQLGACLERVRKQYASGKVAVAELSLAISRGEVFGLLGSNGAGKTTAINVLTGAARMTSGRAWLAGLDVHAEMHRIHQRMGVCAQFDILYFDLTGREHLYFFARLKAVPRARQAAVVAAALDSVQLADAAQRQVKAYSGGMRRRLSVAISLMSAPAIVFLDEPTTGLDPKSKHSLWGSITSARAGKTIVLTTHSMEEAERLCSRVGIMANGKLLCVGAPEEIKFRLGKGYRLSVQLPERHVAAFDAELREHVSDHALLVNSLAGALVYQLPHGTQLSRVFAFVHRASASREIRDWGVSQSTLEDVFVDLASRAEHDALHVQDKH